jgi:MoxR-like ATPase
MVLDEPFFVLATQNPLEMEGTYPLPEAQLDRFLLKLDVPYPTFEVLLEIGELTTGNEMPTPNKVMEAEELVSLQHLVREIVCAPHITEYAARLSLATHPKSDSAPEEITRFVQYGASPRAVQALMLAGRARALLDGRPWTSSDDVKAVAHWVLRHRMILGFEAELEQVTPDMLVDAVLAAVPAPADAH